MTVDGAAAQVCEICGAFFDRTKQSKVDDHIMGKLHMGYARLKVTIERLGEDVARVRGVQERKAAEEGTKESVFERNARLARTAGQITEVKEGEGKEEGRGSRERSRRRSKSRERKRSSDRRRRSRSSERRRRSRSSDRRRRSRSGGRRRSRERRDRSRERRGSRERRRERSRERRRSRSGERRRRSRS